MIRAVGPGTQVGSYRLLEQIGEGGMGAVWLAEHVMLGRRAAIKVLQASFSMQPDIVTRFFNEARAATAIADPGIVQVFDFGHHSDGSAFIVMELLEGETLHARLRRTGPLPCADALRIARQIAGSLGAAHARGIVHRDLKPENVFMVRDAEVAGGERAKILDFGIAKLGVGTSSGTNTHAVLGTPAYMSPEQCRGAGHVDQRADVYSLGCVLFAMLCGRPPFVAAGGGELIAMHLVNEPPRPSELMRTVPADVEEVVMRCLAKEPDARFATTAELATRLGELLGSTSLPSVPIARAAQPSLSTGVSGPRRQVRAAAATATTSTGGPATTLGGASGVTGAAARSGRRGGVIVIGAVATLGMAIGIAVIAASDHAEKPRAADPPVASTSTPVPTPPPVVAPQPPQTPPQPPPVTAPDPDTVAVIAQMKDLLARFDAWAPHHAGAPCPTLRDLGITSPDPWHHRLEVTCSGGPDDEKLGIESAGPDGKLGTDDDVKSWRVHELDDAAKGPRWVAQVRAPSHVTPPQQHTSASPLVNAQGIPTINYRGPSL
jgi:serine/threonine-protein kinase